MNLADRHSDARNVSEVTSPGFHDTGTNLRKVDFAKAGEIIIVAPEHMENISSTIRDHSQQTDDYALNHDSA